MVNLFLYETLEIAKKLGSLDNIDIPDVIDKNLSKKIQIRDYQKDALKNFIYYYEGKGNLRKNKQVHNLFHMATGSGKTVIMASLILYLFTKGYSKFIFFVNQSNLIEKTISNFIDPLSTKYLFNENLEYNGEKIRISKAKNFSKSSNDKNEIEIVFTTIQKLHSDLNIPKENSLTYDDFENNDVVFLSDESHHINALTKSDSKNKKESNTFWEHSINEAFKKNEKNVMLEFTATCDLKDSNIKDKYIDKIIFNYPLSNFRESGYTKDFQNFASNTDKWTRTLIALVVSEYRKYLFADLKVNVKPVVLLKSQTIKESEEFYKIFFNKLGQLSADEIIQLSNFKIDILDKSIDYFKRKDKTLRSLVESIKLSFSEEKSIEVNSEKNLEDIKKQDLLNSLEDKNNNIRIIFAVDMLNEGWDVLNLFDIVRLYDTRQGGPKGEIGKYTIKEAQLIGRGARYCPFIIDNDSENKFIRKFDNDIENPNRILETMFFHSKNDSQYISELKKALIAVGLEPSNKIELEYKLKDEFKNTKFYKHGFVFSNTRIPKSRKNIYSIDEKLKNKHFQWKINENIGFISDMFNTASPNIIKTDYEKKTISLKDINLNILLGAMLYFKVFKFDFLKQKYPNLKSVKEFITSSDYLGEIEVDIFYPKDKAIKTIDYFNLSKHVFEEIAQSIANIEIEYEGTTEFKCKPLRDILKDKKITLSSIDKNGGRGDSQNNCQNSKFKLDLKNSEWYVFEDNFGTNEEKLFLKFFDEHIKPQLEQTNMKYYIVRNERVPELAIYSFQNGNRFEPDFILFILKDENNIRQNYIEPKGAHLIENDRWKEEFLTQINKEVPEIRSINNTKYNYKIIGLPFFSNDLEVKKEQIRKEITNFINDNKTTF